MPISAIFCIFLHCSQLFRGRALCHGRTLEDPLEKSESDSKGKSIFLEIIMFLKQKIDKIGTDSKLQIFSFIIRSSVGLIKYCFDQLSFNQLSFRSNVGPRSGEVGFEGCWTPIYSSPSHVKFTTNLAKAQR